MAQIVGINSDIFRCNISAIQTGGSKAGVVLAADEVWLINTTNSLTNSGSGDCDAYIMGDGTTAATALPLHYLADETPTDGSTNGVQSGSVYLALYGREGNATEGYNLGADNKLYANENKCVSDYIDVPAGNFACFYANGVTLMGSYLVFVNDNYETISAVHLNINTGRQVTKPANATKFRFAFQKGYAAYCAYGGSHFYDAVISADGMKQRIDGIESRVEAIEQADYPSMISDLEEQLDDKASLTTEVVSRNLFNKNDLISGYYIYSDGHLQSSNDNYKVSALIPVKPNTFYYLTTDPNIANKGWRCLAADGTTYMPPLNTEGVAMGYLTTQSSIGIKTPVNAAYFQIQAVWNGVGNIDAIQFEEGTSYSGYDSYEVKRLVPASEMPLSVQNLITASGKKNVISLNFEANANNSITSPFDDTRNIVLNFLLKGRFGIGWTQNPCFNFVNVKLVDKTSGTATTIHTNTDDACPANYNNNTANAYGNSGYMGGNHATQCLSVCTCSSHGKTYADIGSIWTDGSHQFTIVGIPNENSLWIVGQNDATYPRWALRKAVSNVALSHVSGATHTASFTPTAVTLSQWWQGYAYPTLHVYADGQELTEAGTYDFNELKICEVYDVNNPASLLEKIQEGAGTFTENLNPATITTADKVARHTNTYIFSGAQDCVLVSNFVALQNMDFNLWGLTQQTALDGNNKKLYIPLAKSASNGNVTADYRTIVNLSSSVAGDLMPNDWEDSEMPPDRYIEFTDDVAFSCGYVFDYGVGGSQRKNYIGSNKSAMNIASTLKMYPRAAHGITLNAGDGIGGAAWRRYLPISTINKNGIICADSFEFNGNLYIYADFNAAGTYEINVPAKYAGKECEILYKRTNVTLLTSMSSATISIKVGADSVMYGFIAIKL